LQLEARGEELQAADKVCRASHLSCLTGGRETRA
jgi:hypothetical protein